MAMEPEPELEPELRFVFIGVSTGSSNIQRIFPAWMEALGRPNVVLQGVDVPLGASDAEMLAVVDAMQTDNHVVGGLVTSHKLSVFSACRDSFAHLSEVACQLEEVSGIYKTTEGLGGWAADPPVMAAALHRMGLHPQHWRQHTEAEVVCFGCGGAATALAYAIYGEAGEATSALPRLRVTDVDLRRLADLERKCKWFLPQATGLVTFHRADQTDPDGWPSGPPPPHSLVVNATGMGKDVPGTPLGASATFPAGAVVWELNYRGEREFMRQAASAPQDLGLRIVDGWELFLLGWTSVVERVLGIELSGSQTQELNRLAGDVVGRLAAP
jgi:shikimate 5-dehydrogenase